MDVADWECAAPPPPRTDGCPTADPQGQRCTKRGKRCIYGGECCSMQVECIGGRWASKGMACTN